MAISKPRIDPIYPDSLSDSRTPPPRLSTSCLNQLLRWPRPPTDDLRPYLDRILFRYMGRRKAW